MIDGSVPDFNIRAAGPDGVDGAMVVMRSAFDVRWGEAWSASQLAEFLRAGGGSALLLAQPIMQGDPLGFALIRIAADEAELMLLATATQHRRYGVGRALLDSALEAARKSGATCMFLEVRASNESALALYQSAGFNIVGRRNSYYRGLDGQMFDAVTFRRELSA